LRSKIDALGKKRECGEVALWRKSIINHLHFVCTYTPHQEIRESMWRSMVGHIQDIHTTDDEIYTACMHGELTPEERDKEWLKPGRNPNVKIWFSLTLSVLGSKAAVELEEILLNPALLNDIRQASPKVQTSSLEAFHSLLNHFAPKHTSFDWLYMLTRLGLYPH
jgi:hypothetical protein